MNSEIPNPLPTAKPVNVDRFTLNFRAHHQHDGDQPTFVQLVAHQLLTHKEEAYNRKFKVTSDWKPIDTGWLDKDEVGFIIIENLEGKRFQINPTEEEKEDISKRVVEIAWIDYQDNVFLLPPRFPFFCILSDASKLILRCQSDIAKCRIMAVPK